MQVEKNESADALFSLQRFDYELPKDLIAQNALSNRETARLMVVDRQRKTIEHRVFSDILEYFKPDDLLVMNDTRVVKCRLIGKKKTGGKVEIFLLKQRSQGVFQAMIRPARIQPKEVIYFNNGIIAQVLTKDSVKFNTFDRDAIYNAGVIPLPPYIKRPATPQDDDLYQTVYAANQGAVAAPTAGLHFTNELLNAIRKRGVHTAFITLHVGTGTFRPIKDDDIRRHRMDEEEYTIPERTLSLLQRAKDQQNRLMCVGTTVVRTLETFAQTKQSSGQSALFITPGFKFKMTNCLLTNFHLPKTTLFVLTCAFGGEELIKKAYQHAVESKYRFYSYGDAMLIL